MLTNSGVEVFEVYPYATRFLLNIAPKAKKSRKEGRIHLISGLRNYVIGINENLTHDEIDAVMSALTVVLFYEGKAKLVSGKDGSILIPLCLSDVTGL
jgi:predicted nuclease with RNAse H fold